MIKFLKTLFNRPGAPVVAAPAPHETAPINAVQTVRLSLAAVINKFPDDLKKMVLRAPGDDATFALPLPTIQKQLASGSVKMSLASLHRQAPAGVFAPLKSEERRMVEVPLQEIFRHYSPNTLKRRTDQRPANLPDEGFNVFGNKDNPFELSPTVPEDRPASAPAAPAPQAAGRGLQMAPDMRAQLQTRSQNAPAAAAAAPIATPAAAPVASDASILISIADLAAAWPAPIQSEIRALNGAKVALPASAITSGLARGRVSFTWGQIRSWLTPAPSQASALPDATELQLPLKVVAPAFLASTRGGSARKSVAVDDSIPALFAGRVAAPEPAIAIPEPEPVPVAAEPAHVEIETPAVVAPVAAEPTAAPVHHPVHAHHTVGEVLGQPDKHQWSPAEMVKGISKLPGVHGALVALQEGLVVAHSLPETMKSDAVAAFLPQIFARMNQYSIEMSLGDVDDLLFTTHGAHCQIYRLSYIYFAVFGKPGESLPWHELRILADEIGRQTKK